MFAFKLSDVEYIVVCDGEVYFFKSELLFDSFIKSLVGYVSYKVYDLT